MVEQKYRWDFIGLSTDVKPTSETSPKVVDGSTYYCSDTSKLYVWCKDNWYERKPLGGGGGTSNFNQLTNRPKYNGATMTGDTSIPEVKTYTDFVGTDGTATGTAGLVPAPATTDAGKFLKADGTWDTAGGGSSVTVVQTTGTSTTDVMSQNAVSTELFNDPTSREQIKIGKSATSSGNTTVAVGYSAGATGNRSIAIGANNSASNTCSLAMGWASQASGERAIAIGVANSPDNTRALGASSIAIGRKATASGVSAIALGNTSSATANGAIALGTFSSATNVGEMNIGSSSTTLGYNSSNYRLLSGVYDPQTAHDAATKGYVDNIYYLAVTPWGNATGISIFRDSGLTDPITGADFCQALRTGRSMCLRYDNLPFEASMVWLNVAHIPTQDTEEYYDEVFPTAYYHGDDFTKKYMIQLTTSDPTDTDGFDITVI